MRIDLRKLYAYGSLDVNEKIVIPKEMYEKSGVRRISDVSVEGRVFVNYEDEIELDLNLKGKLIMPCAVSLEDVSVPFDTKATDVIDEKMIKNEFYLDLLDILWENIVLEIPIRVVKEGVFYEATSGEGWSLEEKE